VAFITAISAPREGHEIHQSPIEAEGWIEFPFDAHQSARRNRRPTPLRLTNCFTD
jgi:hypothetical protein